MLQLSVCKSDCCRSDRFASLQRNSPAMLFRLRPHFPILTLYYIALSFFAFQPLRVSGSEQKTGSGEINRLFRDEIQQAEKRVKWRGAKLSDDTLYALALTGASWESAWGKDKIFSLEWGAAAKTTGPKISDGANYPDLIRQVQTTFEQKDYRKTVEMSLANFSLQDIGENVSLKESVGNSLMELGRPEQAFPIFSSPFDSSNDIGNLSALDRHFRELALDAAERAGLTREGVAFAFSLILNPGSDSPTLHLRAWGYLEKMQVDMDRVLLGILQSPERLHGLPEFIYPAADLLVLRASPRLVPYLLILSESQDVYLKCRSLLALGVAGYQSSEKESPDWLSRVLYSPIQSFNLSSGQSKLIEKRIREGCNSDRYKIRIASALALALMDVVDARQLLLKLSKDRAYVLSTAKDSPFNSRRKHIEYPVRAAAAAALARYGIKQEVIQGDFEGKALEAARRGGQDASSEKFGTRKSSSEPIRVSPQDAS